MKRQEFVRVWILLNLETEICLMHVETLAGFAMARFVATRLVHSLLQNHLSLSWLVPCQGIISGGGEVLFV